MRPIAGPAAQRQKRCAGEAVVAGRQCQVGAAQLLLEPGGDLSAGDRLPAATTHPRASDPATRHAGATN
jgi:hypothetical protein